LPNGGLSPLKLNQQDIKDIREFLESDDIEKERSKSLKIKDDLQN